MKGAGPPSMGVGTVEEFVLLALADLRARSQLCQGMVLRLCMYRAGPLPLEFLKWRAMSFGRLQRLWQGRFYKHGPPFDDSAGASQMPSRVNRTCGRRTPK